MSGVPAAVQVAAGGGAVELADLADAPGPVRALIRMSYGDATGRIFLASAVVSVVAVLAVLVIREVALRTATGGERQWAERSDAVRLDTDRIEGPLTRHRSHRRGRPPDAAAGGPLTGAAHDGGPPPRGDGPPAGPGSAVRTPGRRPG